MKYICIIGAGPSGLTAAIIAARKGKKVTIIERNEKCAKKLLITGNGRCNYYNENQDIKHYHSNNPNLIKNIINKENINKVKEFFKSLEIIPKIIDGYYYPITNQAQTIYNALIYEIEKLNIEIIYGLKVEEIKKEEYYIINPKKEKIISRNILLATGGKSAPKTGSDGIGYKILENLNHKIIEPLPALVKLKGNEKYFKKWNGIRTDVILKLYEDEKLIKEEKGQIQLTDNGISGIAAFNLSTHITKNIGKKEEKIMINFMPWLNENPYEFMKRMTKLNLTISKTLERFLNYKLVNIILKKANIKTDNFKKLSNKDLSKLIRTLTNFEIIITDVGSLEKAQITKGGLPLNEINLNKMESLKNKNLFISGEIIDIDADCGGYNLTLAWITGIIAGENI